MSFLFEYFPCKVTQSEDSGKMNNDVMSPCWCQIYKEREEMWVERV